MDKISKSFPEPSAEYPWLELGFDRSRSDSNFHITDKRMARLLLVLHELDKSVAGLEALPESKLSELVSSAILSCGFVDRVEAQKAIAAVLETIEMHDLQLGNL